MNEIKTLLPPNNTLLEKNIESVFAERLLVLGTPNREVTYPENCPVTILPWLAWEMHVDRWDENWEEGIRRDLVKSSFLIHKQKGTIGALKEALTVFQVDKITVQEWFEYEGVPYTFRIVIEMLTQGFDMAKINDIFAMIDLSKNARSHLESLHVFLTVKTPVPVIGIGCLSGEITTLYPKRD